MTEYLGVIERISEDDTKEDISANKEKINRIYERIADTFDFLHHPSRTFQQAAFATDLVCRSSYPLYVSPLSWIIFVKKLV